MSHFSLSKGHILSISFVANIFQTEAGRQCASLGVCQNETWRKCSTSKMFNNAQRDPDAGDGPKESCPGRDSLWTGKPVGSET